MQTDLADFIKDTQQGKEADAILRACVHCGFCTAVCPTYQLLGDELDSPRGRIYLIKQVLEGETATAKMQLHLDRCLTCRACETVCPSGVQYGHLVDIGRDVIEKKVGRDPVAKLKMDFLRYVLLKPFLFDALLGIERMLRPLLPPSIRRKIPVVEINVEKNYARLTGMHSRKMLVLQGCVQPVLNPNIDAAAARVLDQLGVSLIAVPRDCCGAINYHLNAQNEGLDDMRRNIDSWWPYVEQGIEAIVITASGCGVMVKEYGHLLRHDAAYADKAKKISALAKDVSEVIAAEKNNLMAKLQSKKTIPQKIAFHPPCTLQHGLKIRGVVEDILRGAGFDLTVVPDAHLCCGSAGTYSILQPVLSEQLKQNKLIALKSGAPEIIATANIGCLTHLQSGTDIKVKHWIELIDEQLITH
jgi:glycolate oxidase iron-sulfur subunit